MEMGSQRIVPLALGVHALAWAPLRLRLVSLLIFLLAGTLVGACSLNPQPIPPGEAAADAGIDGAFSTDGSMDGEVGSDTGDADGGSDASSDDANAEASDAWEAE
jgi:hypothetical protein